MNIFGKWESFEAVGHQNPVGGLAYMIMPPQSWRSFIFEPIHVLFYAVFISISCGIFARLWIDISGTSARDITRQLNEKEM